MLNNNDKYKLVDNKDKFNLYKFDWSTISPTHLPMCMISNNLGDDIQTVSAMKLWGIKNVVDRDKPEQWGKEDIVPLTGWFGYGDFPTPASAIIIGFHCALDSIDNLRQPKTIDWLKWTVKNQGFPALCRDTYTTNLLRSLGVEAEFGGCVSLQLPKYTKERSGILNIDAHHIKGGTILSHVFNGKLNTIEQRINKGKNQLQLIRSASLIKTTRLHAWLPAIASGTECHMYEGQVSYQRERLSGYI